ncbi:hypothetical protein O181_055486 [Austropuccinia psidii MF-1]|uniref:Uncharacterized protein n=1 Tax=Austropuccinia psidii MF-1 TaxID=1389203 RepID=A0A9Q3HS36_9BASI|nr:hypothetical protein [Austropuccinia psidii MF-1]
MSWLKNKTSFFPSCKIFYNDSRLKETNLSTKAFSHLSESSGPYKSTYYCTNRKHNPNCTNLTKGEHCSKHPHILPPCQDNKRKYGPNRSLADQAFITSNNLASSSQFLITYFGATHHMFN